jgi:hypothetical protein
MVNICGLEVTVKSSKNSDADIRGNKIHTKKDRSKLDAERKATVFVQATTKLPGGLRFNALPMILDDPKQLSTYQNIDNVILAAKEHCYSYDMADVFNLVYPVDLTARPDLLPLGGIPKTTNLWEEYSNVSVETVAKSNAWYHLWTNDDDDQFHTNMNWSYLFLKSIIDPAIMSRLQSKYDPFPKVQQGGPLLFILLMNELMHSNESAVKALKEQVIKYNIAKVAGEDVRKISSILLSVSKRIYFSRKRSFPEDYLDTIIGILQTTSVPVFNEHFRNIALTRASDSVALLIAKNSAQPEPIQTYRNDLATVEKLLGMATTFYESYSRDGTWNTYVKTRAKGGGTDSTTPASTLHTALLTTTCFNCGSKDHVLPACPKERNEQRIAANKSKFREQKKLAKAASKSNGKGQPSASKGTTDSSDTHSTGSSSGQSSSTSNNTARDKFRPPSEGESHQRFIWTRSHGSQPYKWNTQTNRWDIMVPLPTSNQGANNRTSSGQRRDSGEASSSSLTTASSTKLSDGTSDAALRARLAEMERKLQQLNDKL